MGQGESEGQPWGRAPRHRTGVVVKKRPVMARGGVRERMGAEGEAGNNDRTIVAGVREGEVSICFRQHRTGIVPLHLMPQIVFAQEGRQRGRPQRGRDAVARGIEQGQPKPVLAPVQHNLKRSPPKAREGR